MQTPQRNRFVFDYPPEYGGPRPLTEQISHLVWRFGLSPIQALAYVERGLPQLPPGAEGWFAVPSVDGLAVRIFPEVADPVERYRRAVRHAFRVLGATQEFNNQSAESQVIPGLCRAERSAQALALIAQEQPGDILIVAAQIGRLHRGLAAREIEFNAWEYGLGTFEAAVIILTHPQRLVRLEELDLDCPGDTCARMPDGQPSNVPVFSHSGSGIVCSSNWRGSCCDRTGQATGFLPGGTKLDP
jgi:hypothetical protein